MAVPKKPEVSFLSKDFIKEAFVGWNIGRDVRVYDLIKVEQKMRDTWPEATDMEIMRVLLAWSHNVAHEILFFSPIDYIEE